MVFVVHFCRCCHDPNIINLVLLLFILSLFSSTHVLMFLAHSLGSLILAASLSLDFAAGSCSYTHNHLQSHVGQFLEGSPLVELRHRLSTDLSEKGRTITFKIESLTLT